MTRVGRILLSVLVVGTMMAGAETPAGNSATLNDATPRPVAQDQMTHRWEYGPFVNYGFGVGDRSSYKFLWAGFQLGKSIFPAVHAGIFSGRFELGGNIMPLWQAYTPAPHNETFSFPGIPPYVAPVGGGTFRGVSLTPAILRWNFITSSKRVKPWFQGAGGVIYTTHKFPPAQLVPQGTPGGTSVWNFSPQGGIGVHYFVRPGRSIDLGVNAVHISSASLGDRNPGVNASVQIQVGYTYWK